MRDAHRGVGLVDVLAARARGTKGIDAQIGRVDLDVDRLVDLGIHEDAGKRRMPPRVGIERALADQAVHAGLRAQVAVRVITRHLDAGALDAGDFAFGLLENLGPVALALAIAQVHPQQHCRPVLGFRAAAARLNVDEARVRIHRVVEHPTEFHVAHRALEFCDVGRDCGERRVVAFAAGKIEQLGAVLEPHIESGQRADDTFELLSFLAELLCALGIVPDAGVLERLGDRNEPFRLDVEVKDTSADRQRVAAARRGCWQSG